MRAPPASASTASTTSTSADPANPSAASPPPDLKPSKALLEASRAEMDSASVPDEEILTTIADVYKEGNGYTLDPHSAIGVAAARKARKPNATDVPMIVLACAHWAKFPDANKAALGAEKVRGLAVVASPWQFAPISTPPASRSCTVPTRSCTRSLCCASCANRASMW